MRSLRRFGLVCVLSVVVVGEGRGQMAAVPAEAAPAYRSDPKFNEALKEAKRLQRQRNAFAADAFKKANKIAGGQCVECLEGLYEMDVAMPNWKEAVATASALEGLATTPLEKAMAQMKRGRALYLQGGEKPKMAQLEAADAALKESVATFPRNPGALMLDGTVLAKMGKMDEAKSQFENCLSCTRSNDAARLRVQHFAENPALSIAKMAPAFTVTALDGSKFSLDEMGGRVVLIDFWATWCGPCNAELPQMKKIAKEFAGQPLVILSVSWDADETKWKEFVAKNEMTWTQFRDADHKLTERFGINAIPHYFTIDSDGVLTSEMLGEGSNVEGKLKKLVARAKDAQQKVAAVAVVRPVASE